MRKFGGPLPGPGRLLPRTVETVEALTLPIIPCHGCASALLCHESAHLPLGRVRYDEP